MRVKRNIRLMTALLVVMVVTGCSSTAVVQDAVSLAEREPVNYEISYQTAVEDDWKRLFEVELRDELVRVGLLAPEDAENANLVSINFLVFRLRDDGTRFMAGIFAGTDEIKSEIIVRNSDGEEIGRSVVTTSNASAWGSNSGYLEDHARDIAAFLSGGEDSESVPFTTAPLLE